MLETSALNFLQRPIYVIKSVDNTKLPCTIHLYSFVARSALTWVQCANCWVTTSVHENSLEKERLTLQYSPLGNLSVKQTFYNQISIASSELSLYELHRTPQEAITDGTEISISPRSLHSELMCPICLDMLKNTMTTKEVSGFGTRCASSV